MVRARELELAPKWPEGIISYVLSIYYETLTATEKKLFWKNEKHDSFATATILFWLLSCSIATDYLTIKWSGSSLLQGFP